jgi:hypothetical protein
MTHHRDRIRLRRNTKNTWTALNPILDPGEPGLEIDTGKLKIGNGVARWSELFYFVPDDPNAIAPPAPEPSAPEPVYVEPDPPANLLEHVESETPHPVYDDGPSLLLLYQNAKV